MGQVEACRPLSARGGRCYREERGKERENESHGNDARSLFGVEVVSLVSVPNVSQWVVDALRCVGGAYFFVCYFRFL